MDYKDAGVYVLLVLEVWHGRLVNRIRLAETHTRVKVRSILALKFLLIILFFLYLIFLLLLLDKNFSMGLLLTGPVEEVE